MHAARAVGFEFGFNSNHFIPRMHLWYPPIHGSLTIIFEHSIPAA